MRTLFTLLGNLLIAAGVAGALLVFVGLPAPLAAPLASVPELYDLVAQPADPTLDATAPAASDPVVAGANTLSSDQSAGVSADQSVVASAPAPGVSAPITRLVLPGIGLDVQVVPARIVQVDGGATWQVPAFKAGHAQGTAGAGEPGNAVLFGHVTSVHSGDVFKDLERVQVGDSIQVFSGAQRFAYRVTERVAVPRTDGDVLEPTATPTLTLITCTGTWVPSLWDYDQRLAVRAVLEPTGGRPSA